MKTGTLRTRITIQQATNVTSESGQTVKTWSAYGYEYADIRTPSGRDFFGSDKFNAQVTHTVLIRWRDGVTEKMRVKWGTRTLNIVYISEDRTHERNMVLNCAEEKA